MKSTHTPYGFVEKMTAHEVDISYPGFDADTKWIVQTLLDVKGGYPIRQVHSRMDAPALAIRALTTHIGRVLPVYDAHGIRQAGETRVITHEDSFNITEGPFAVVGGRFVSILQREGGPEYEPLILVPGEWNVNTDRLVV